MKPLTSILKKSALIAAAVIAGQLLTGCAQDMAMIRPGQFPAYGYSPGYQPIIATPTTIHYSGTGIGAIQAGLMNNLGRH